MKKNLISQSCYALATIVLLSFSSCESEQITPQDTNSATLDIMSSSKGKTTSSNTAQSISVEMNVSENELEGSIVWSFETGNARAYYPELSGNPAKNAAARADQCIFFNGGILSNGTVVAPKTAWKSEGSGGATEANPEINIRIAAQSLVDNGKKGVKYSFSLTEERVQNLKAVITDENDNIIGEADGYSNFSIVNDPAVVGEFDYVENGGTFGGVTNLLQNNKTIAEILSMNAFGSNEVSGGIVVFETIVMPSVAVGDYTITVTGTLKGNEGSLDTEFSVISTGTVTGGCNE